MKTSLLRPAILALAALLGAATASAKGTEPAPKAAQAADLSGVTVTAGPKPTPLVDPTTQFVRQHLKIADHKPILRKITRRYVDNMIRDTPNPHCDLAKRVAEALRRMGTDTLTGFKREFPRQFERLASLPLETLNIGNELEWVGGNVGELSPLSPTYRKRHRIRLRIEE